MGSRIAYVNMSLSATMLRWVLSALMVCLAYGDNSTFNNPILPGFHPDPSCVFVPEWNETFFCASSSFNAFPGIPIHASKDLQNWKLIGIGVFFSMPPQDKICGPLSDCVYRRRSQ